MSKTGRFETLTFQSGQIGFGRGLSGRQIENSPFCVLRRNPNRLKRRQRFIGLTSIRKLKRARAGLTIIITRPTVAHIRFCVCVFFNACFALYFYNGGFWFLTRDAEIARDRNGIRKHLSCHYERVVHSYYIGFERYVTVRQALFAHAEIVRGP